MSENTITQAADNIFLDLGFSAQEADNLLIRSQLMLALQNQIKHHGWTIDQTAQHLKQSSDEIKALTQGKIGQFSVDTLIIMLNQVGMTVKVEICPPGSLGRSPFHSQKPIALLIYRTKKAAHST
jgi:predicted XRE-type DNA-binding protein